MQWIRNNIRKIKKYYLIFALVYIIICFVPFFNGGVQDVLRKLFCIVLIGFTVIEFTDNLNEMDSGA